MPGQYRGGYEGLDAYCRAHYQNYAIHRGYFDRSLTDELLKALADSPPILVWFDCDYYSSSRVVFERLVDHLPNGAVLYFDEVEFNFGSRYTGEARLIHEANAGAFGTGVELIRDATCRCPRIAISVLQAAAESHTGTCTPTVRSEPGSSAFG